MKNLNTVIPLIGAYFNFSVRTSASAPYLSYFTISDQQDLVNKLGSLPLRTDTFRMRSCKQELEAKLAEMEEAIKIFSRPKVFVKNES